MSLIVARNESNSLVIVSDTKLSLPKERQGDRNDKIGLPSSGVIKTAIISPFISVSFAGGEWHADKALKEISATDSPAQVLDLVLKAHLDSNGETDFIVAVGGSQCQLFEIKEAACIEVEVAWIGSKNAFSVFQSFMHGGAKSDRIGFFNIELVAVEDINSSFSVMSKAMDYVIDCDKVPEVGGFKVSVAFTKGKFGYIGYTTVTLGRSP